MADGKDDNSLEREDNADSGEDTHGEHAVAENRDYAGWSDSLRSHQ